MCFPIISILLFIYTLASHKNFGFVIEWKGSIILPETVEQLHIFELLVLITDCEEKEIQKRHVKWSSCEQYIAPHRKKYQQVYGLD